LQAGEKGWFIVLIILQIFNHHDERIRPYFWAKGSY
jgi:hypothetical protein